ncbi:MAG: hypothetical protein AAF497_09110 [Planctomycetota bacterium]
MVRLQMQNEPLRGRAGEWKWRIGLSSVTRLRLEAPVTSLVRSYRRQTVGNRSLATAATLGQRWLDLRN